MKRVSRIPNFHVGKEGGKNTTNTNLAKEI
jgi:hypothetical protein